MVVCTHPECQTTAGCRCHNKLFDYTALKARVASLDAELAKRPDWETVNIAYEKWKARAEAAEAQLAKEKAENDRLRTALFSTPGTCLFLDGRNEHGSHVIPSLPTSLPEEGYIEDLPNYAEEILVAAESLGFEAGDHVWTEWRWNRPQCDEYGRVEFSGYWEFVRVIPEISKAINDAALARCVDKLAPSLPSTKEGT